MIVGFSKPSKFKIVSWIIQKWQKTEFSHAYIKFYSQKYDRHMIYEASHTTVHFEELNNWLERNTVVKEFDIGDEKRDHVIIFAIDNCNKPYSLRSLIGVLFGKPNFGKDGNNAFICSELVAKAIGIDIADDFYKPIDLFNYLNNTK